MALVEAPPRPALPPGGVPERAVATLRQQDGLDFAVLVGSRAAGAAHAHSDWDIALGWSPALPWLERVARTESLRRALATAIGEPEARIDLIDLANTNLAMRAAVAEEGLPLHGDDTLAWARFLRRTWRELEEHYWGVAYAAGSVPG